MASAHTRMCAPSCMALLNLWEQREQVAIGTCLDLNFWFLFFFVYFKFHLVGTPRVLTNVYAVSNVYVILNHVYVA